MSENLEGTWLFEFEDGQGICFAVHEAVEDRDDCIDLIEINHGKVTEQLEDADFVLFSNQTPGIEELLQDGRAQGKPALDVNWIHRCRGVERIVPWYSFQIGTRDLALTKLSAEARDEHEMVLFMARYGPVLNLKQSFEKLERLFPHRSARKFRDLYTQRSSRLVPQITSLQHRLDNVLKPTLRLVPPKPRLNFSRSAPRLASTFDIHTNAIESLDLCQSWEDPRSQTPLPSSVLPSVSMTSHCPSSTPISRPVPHLSAFTPLPPEDDTRSLETIPRATEHPQIPTPTALGDTSDHTRASAETNIHATSHTRSVALDSRQDVAGSEISVITRSSGSSQVDSARKNSSAEDEHWAAAVEYTATRESSWKGLAHWRGFIRWYKQGRVRSAVAWQSWFSRRRSKFLGDVRATRAKRALDASTKLDNGEPSETQSQSNANDERFNNDPRDCEEDVNALVEYLLARPCRSDENPTVYWKGFRTSYKDGKSRTATEWLTYYSRNFQTIIQPAVEKRARELKVNTVLRIKDKEIRIFGNPVEGQGLQTATEVAEHFIRAEQVMAPRRQENAFSIPQTQMESPRNRQTKNITTRDLGPVLRYLKSEKRKSSYAPMTLGGPYTLEEDIAIALYQETHPFNKWTREDYWQIFVDWFPPANRPASTYEYSARRRRSFLLSMRRKVREARARGIGVGGSSEARVTSLVSALSKRKRDEEDQEDAEDSHPTSKRQRTMGEMPEGDQPPAADSSQYSGMRQSSEAGDSPVWVVEVQAHS